MGRSRLPLAADQAHSGFERQQRGRIIGRRIGMRDAAADGAHVAHLHIADVRCRLGQQRAAGTNERRAFHLIMRGGGADPQHAAFLANEVQIRDPAKVHQLLRRGQAQLHHRDQAHAAGQQLGVFLRQQPECVLETGRSRVLEILRDHARPPCWIRFQIFSGVIGMSICRTPNGLSASTTELTTAGEAPMVPASPTPLTPSGFTGDGVTV